MKATTLISALVFAGAAFAQESSAAGSQSTSKSSTKSASQSQSQSQSSTAATPTGATVPISESLTAEGNPLIPSTASTACSTFLNTLNTDTALSACLQPLQNAVSAYSTTSGSASGLSKTLTNLCSSNACSASMMRSKLTEYKDACGDELTGANPDKTVIQNYDVLYTLIAFKNAMCTKDVDTQAYCLLNTGSTSTGNTTTSNSVTYATNHLSNAVVAGSRKRAQTVLVPNTDTYRNANLMYLFTSPDMNAGELCTSCTQQIVSKYIAWESSTPHALGLKNSPLLGGQSELWSAIQEKCPASFLTEVTNIAGVASAEDINSGASPAFAGSIFTAVAGALAAVMALV